MQNTKLYINYIIHFTGQRSVKHPLNRWEENMRP